MNQRWNRLREVVEQALAIDAGERDTWLEQECADDAELREEARAVIGAALKEEGFLEPEPAAPRAPALDAGDRVGPYRLVRLLASGGMGTVYEAERESPRRRVALKLMRTGLDGPGARSRFRYEVEVLAKLSHPGIASMYETGVHVEDGRELPWFAMEYVEDARPIVSYAREEGSSLRDRVALFADACDAVHHGHSHGVLHRDLKPANLLVNRDGRPKVIDFGVARATDTDRGLVTLRTTTGEIVGTIHYMSPEQVAGDGDALDTRSDVYALGVVLYELLTGELPYEVRGGNALTAMRTIRDAAPRRPSDVLPPLRGDLETILLKCLEKEPERRYDSAAALADDLRRFLGHEPIAAHPPSVTYQIRVFARRHRALVAATIVVVAVSVAAAITSTAFAVRAVRSERLALAEKERSSEMFETLLGRSTETSARFVPRLMELSGASPIVLEMTKANLEDLRALDELAAADPRARREVAKAYLQLGAIQGDPNAATQLGDRAAALRAYLRASEIARELHEAEPEDADALLLYAMTLGSLGYVKLYERDHEGARKVLEEAESLMTRFCRRHPGLLAGEQTLAQTLMRLAKTARWRGDTEAERGYIERAHRTRLAMAARWPGDPSVRYDLTHSHGARAVLQEEDGDLEGALSSRRSAISELERLVSESPGNTLFRQALAIHLRVAGDLLVGLGSFTEGTESMRRALDLSLELQRQDPENRQLPMNIVLAQFSLAGACDRQAEAEGDAALRRTLLERARDAYHAIVLQYESRGNGHSGFAEQARRRYEELRAELGE